MSKWIVNVSSCSCPCSFLLIVSRSLIMEEEFQTLSFFFLSKGKRYTVQGLPACAKGRTRNMGSIEALARPRHNHLRAPLAPTPTPSPSLLPAVDTSHASSTQSGKTLGSGPALRRCRRRWGREIRSLRRSPKTVSSSGPPLVPCSQADAVLKWRLRRPGPHGSATPTARCATPPSSPSWSAPHIFDLHPSLVCYPSPS